MNEEEKDTFYDKLVDAGFSLEDADEILEIVQAVLGGYA